MDGSAQSTARPTLISGSDRQRLLSFVGFAGLAPRTSVAPFDDGWLNAPVHANGLLRLLDSASVGHRVFELLSIGRWRDLEPYLVDFHDLFAPDVLPVQIVAPEFAALGMFSIVKAAQRRLRETDDPMTREEIQRFDNGTHWRFALADPCWRNAKGVPEPTSTLPADLLQFVIDTIRRPDIGSVSCDQDDYALWRLLVQEQLRRTRPGRDPLEAFCLAGPDGGLSFVEPRDWGGYIHIPYEGMLEGDLLFLPKWRRFNPESAIKYGRLRSSVGKHCKIVISERDFGEMGSIERTSFGSWVVYADPARSDPFNPLLTGYGRSRDRYRTIVGTDGFRQHGGQA